MDIAADSANQVVIVGSIDTSDGARRTIPLARKFDPCGRVLWSDTTGVSPNYGGQFKAVALDPSDNAYAVGYASPACPPLCDEPGLTFIRKYSPSGTILWTILYTLDEYKMGEDILLDSSGNIFVGGSAGDPGAWDTMDPWLIKYTAGGPGVPSIACEDVPALGSRYEGITIDGADHIYAVTSGWDVVADSILMKKYSPSSCSPDLGFGGGTGVLFDTPILRDLAWDIAVTATGDLAVVGDISTPVIPEEWNPSNIWVHKFSGTLGVPLWPSPFTLDSGMYDRANAVHLNGSDILVAGYFGNGGFADAWFAKLNSEGSLVWSRSFGDFGGEVGSVQSRGITNDSLGNIYVAGFVSNPGEDWTRGYLFVRKYPPDGVCPGE